MSDLIWMYYAVLAELARAAMDDRRDVFQRIVALMLINILMIIPAIAITFLTIDLFRFVVGIY